MKHDYYCKFNGNKLSRAVAVTYGDSDETLRSRLRNPTKMDSWGRSRRRGVRVCLEFSAQTARASTKLCVCVCTVPFF